VTGQYRIDFEKLEGPWYICIVIVIEMLEISDIIKPIHRNVTAKIVVARI